jgi:ABC-type Fe3+ transport system substrate-binding protein
MRRKRRRRRQRGGGGGRLARAEPIAVAALVSLINKNAEYPYAAALFSDWTLSDECQTILFEEFRGPVVGKHPFYPDNAKLVAYGSVPRDIENKLVDIWKKHMRGK